MEPADRSLFEAYGLLAGAQTEYLETHYRRYRETLALIADLQPESILELGSQPPFTLMLRRAFPKTRIVLAENTGPASVSQHAPVWKQTRVLDTVSAAGERLLFEIWEFNAEVQTWPFDAESFDLVLCLEVLEHLLINPYFLFQECHRVLRQEGRFVVTTPNIACLESVQRILDLGSPYTFGVYSLHGEYGRHNREYVPDEVRQLGESSGFETGLLTTRDVYGFAVDPAEAREILQHRDPDLNLRGQTIFYVGSKNGASPARYPPNLFQVDASLHAAIVRIVGWSGAIRGAKSLKVEVTNRGRYTWQPDGKEPTRLGVRVLDEEGTVVLRDFSRISLPRPVHPGEHLTMGCSIPQTEVPDGSFLELDMVHEGVCWFSEAPQTSSRAARIRYDWWT